MTALFLTAKTLYSKIRQVPVWWSAVWWTAYICCPHVAEINRHEHTWGLTKYWNHATWSLRPIQCALPVPSKTFVHYSFSELCFNILTTKKISEMQVVPAGSSCSLNTLLTARQAFLWKLILVVSQLSDSSRLQEGIFVYTLVNCTIMLT